MPRADRVGEVTPDLHPPLNDRLVRATVYGRPRLRREGGMKGTIRVRVNKDGSKSYVCQVKFGRDPGTGKERVLSGTAKSERAANRLLHDLIARVDDRTQHASDVTVARVIEQWLATGGPAGEATRQVYEGYIRLHVLPTLGDIPLRKLGVVDLERWYAALREEGLGPASIRKAHTIVRARARTGGPMGLGAGERCGARAPPVVPKAVIATPNPSEVRADLGNRSGARSRARGVPASRRRSPAPVPERCVGCGGPTSTLIVASSRSAVAFSRSNRRRRSRT